MKGNDRQTWITQCLCKPGTLKSCGPCPGVSVNPAEIHSFGPLAWYQPRYPTERAPGMLPGDVLGIICIFNPWIEFTSKMEHIEMRYLPKSFIIKNIKLSNNLLIFFPFISLTKYLLSDNNVPDTILCWGHYSEQIKVSALTEHIPERTRIY